MSLAERDPPKSLKPLSASRSGRLDRCPRARQALLAAPARDPAANTRGWHWRPLPSVHLPIQVQAVVRSFSACHPVLCQPLAQRPPAQELQLPARGAKALGANRDVGWGN